MARRMKKFPFYKQPDTMDCGPTCLRMVAKHHGRSISLQKLRSNSETTRAGSSLKGISEAAEKIGFRTLGVKVDFINLEEKSLEKLLQPKSTNDHLPIIQSPSFFISQPLIFRLQMFVVAQYRIQQILVNGNVLHTNAIII